MNAPTDPAPGRRVAVCIGETSTVRSSDILVQPIDLEAFRSGVPSNARIRGHFANQTAAHVEKVCPEAIPDFIKLHPERVPALRSIAFRDFLPIVYDVARLAYPETPVAEGIRRVGRAAYDTVLRSLL